MMELAEEPIRDRVLYTIPKDEQDGENTELRGWHVRSILQSLRVYGVGHRVFCTALYHLREPYGAT